MSQERENSFHHVILKGDAYQVGKTQGEMIKNFTGFVHFLGSGGGRFSPEEFKNIQEQMEHFCPVITSEIKGMADALGIREEALIFYAFTYLPKGHCSHFALLPSRTEEGKTLVGRSYEFDLQSEDLRLCTMQVNDKYAFIGSSVLFFGFTEGMNEHGLVVTMSAGGLPVGAAPGMRKPIIDGFQFWFIIRAVLEQCKTVEEAIKLIMEIPTCGNPNIIVAEKSGKAALVEIFGVNKAVKIIDAHTAEQYVCSANHFTLPEMLPHRDPVWKNSQTRYDAIRVLAENEKKVTREAMKTLLSSEYPKGLACHYYEQGFGTLRSMIFDPQAAEIEVCFGSPVGTSWHRIDFNSPMMRYEMLTPHKKMPEDFMAPVE